VARVYMRQTRAGQGGPLALVSMYQGRSHRRGVGTRAIMMPPGPALAQAGSGHWALATAVASTPSKAGPPQVSPGSSDTAVGCDGGSNLRARALGTSREQPFVDKCKSTYQSQLEVFPRAWHGRRPATHRPSPGPPHGVGEAGLVGVAGRLPGNSCVMAAYRCQAAHPRPAEVAQARNNDRLGSVGGSRARLLAAWGDISCARHPGNTPRVGACRRRDRLSHSNRDAQAIRARQHIQTSCHELREAVYRGSCNAQQRADPIWRVANE
jgi:hypothetical protein